MIQLVFTTTFSSISAAISMSAEGDEPVATLPDGDTTPFTYSIGGVDYTQRQPDLASLTGAMIEAASTYITKPTISGTPQAGATMTLTPALALYAGDDDPGLPTFQVYLDDVLQVGEIGDTYVLQAGDNGKELHWTQTVGGVTIESDPLTLVYVDTTAPLLISTVPANYAINVALNGNISLVFNEAIARGTGNIILRQNTGTWADLETFDAAASGALSITTTNIASDTLVINPSSNFMNARNYAIRVAATAIEDASGNAFAGIADDATTTFKSRATTTLTTPLDLTGLIVAWYDYKTNDALFTEATLTTKATDGQGIDWVENKAALGTALRFDIADSSRWRSATARTELGTPYSGFYDINDDLVLEDGMEMYFAISTTRATGVLLGTRFTSNYFGFRINDGGAGSPHNSLIGTPTYLINDEDRSITTQDQLHTAVSTGTPVIVGAYGLNLAALGASAQLFSIFSHQGTDDFRLKGAFVTDVVLTKTLTPTQRTNLYGLLSQRATL